MIERSSLRGLEDEALVNMSTTSMLEELGCVVASFMRLAEAAAAVANWMPSAAVLDVNVGGQKSFDFGRLLAARGVAIVFLTGYDATALKEAGVDSPHCQKPCRVDVLEAAVLTAVNAREGR